MNEFKKIKKEPKHNKNMGILDQITQMKSQGRNDQEIVSNLQQQGIPPKQIQEALGQAQIKNAVVGQNSSEMQQSIMDQTLTPEENQMYEVPIPQQYLEAMPQEPYPQQTQDTYAQEYSDQQNYSPQEYYPQESYGYSGGTSDNGTLIEIAEQVFSEKNKKVQKILEALAESKVLTETKVKLIDERLKRLEATIDQLQISILERIGSYGQNLSSIKKEMSMMQDSFGKVIRPLVDKKYKRKI